MNIVAKMFFIVVAVLMGVIMLAAAQKSYLYMRNGYTPDPETRFVLIFSTCLFLFSVFVAIDL